MQNVTQYMLGAVYLSRHVLSIHAYTATYKKKVYVKNIIICDRGYVIRFYMYRLTPIVNEYTLGMHLRLSYYYLIIT
jgi:hypothetical protein